MKGAPKWQAWLGALDSLLSGIHTPLIFQRLWPGNSHGVISAPDRAQTIQEMPLRLAS